MPALPLSSTVQDSTVQDSTVQELYKNLYLPLAVNNLYSDAHTAKSPYKAPIIDATGLM
jgi:hypothetical protein